MMSTRFDVIVVGAALNGLAAGLALGGHRTRRPLSVAIVDFGIPPWSLLTVMRARHHGQLQADVEALGWDHVTAYAEMREIIVTDGESHDNRRSAAV
jgi:2-polyprenyl-6-methoxyphenol hydroxylase-like FAD-dependent oxidoreductase